MVSWLILPGFSSQSWADTGMCSSFLSQTMMTVNALFSSAFFHVSISLEITVYHFTEIFIHSF